MGVAACDAGADGALDRERLNSIASSFAAAKPVLRAGPGWAVAHALTPVTPEDRFERMPLSHAGGRLLLLFDGRLDNRAELMAALGLEAAGRTLPDGAILAAAIERWGDEACRHLCGDFAYASWDVAARRLVLACDQVGGRALYYHADGSRIVFATTVHAVLGVPDVPRRLDEDVLARALLMFPLTVGRTMYRDVAMVPSAGRVVWQAGRLRRDRYWEVDFGRRIQFRQDTDYVEAAREILDRAVADRLRAEGPLVCHLSGGLDSSGVAATAARMLDPGTLHTLTLLPDPTAPLPQPGGGYFFEERPLAESVARQYPNMVAHMIQAVLPTPEEERAQATFLHTGWPIRTAHNLHWHGSAKPLVRELGAKVVLTGTPGNITLSHDGILGLGDDLRGLRLWRLGREVLALHRRGGRPIRDILKYRVLAEAFPALWQRLRKLAGKREQWRDWMALDPAVGESMDADTLWRTRGVDPGHRGPDRWSRMWMFENFRFARGLRAGLRAVDGFETREPLGDMRLAEFCVGIPRDLFLRNGVRRWFARRVLEDRLPAPVIAEQRLGFQNPEWFTWMSRRRDWYAEELEAIARSPTASRLADLPRLRAMLDAWPADAQAAEPVKIAMIQGLGRAVRVGQFIRWVEGGNL